MKKFSLLIVLIVSAGLMPLSSQSVNMKAGVFIPSLQSELWNINRSNLTFDKADMVDVYYTAEYEQFINKALSLGLEGGIYKQEIFSAYKDWVFAKPSTLTFPQDLEYIFGNTNNGDISSTPSKGPWMRDSQIHLA